MLLRFRCLVSGAFVALVYEHVFAHAPIALPLLLSFCFLAVCSWSSAPRPCSCVCNDLWVCICLVLFPSAIPCFCICWSSAGFCASSLALPLFWYGVLFLPIASCSVALVLLLIFFTHVLFYILCSSGRILFFARIAFCSVRSISFSRPLVRQFHAVLFVVLVHARLFHGAASPAPSLYLVFGVFSSVMFCSAPCSFSS